MATHMKQHGDAVPPQKTQPASDAVSADAIVQLKSDHRLVEDLFEQYDSAKTPAQKQKLAHTICHELTIHAALEENFFYPRAREVLPADQDLIDEAVVEHSSLKWLIAQLELEPVSADLYDAKVTVLKEYVQHHVKEEEKEFFPKIRKSTLDLVELGKTLASEKKNLQKELPH